MTSGTSGVGANSEKDDIAMRMPWNFLRGRKSKKTSQETDVEKLPSSSVISLKIRVADNADLPAYSPSQVATPVSEELRSNPDAAPDPAIALAQDEDRPVTAIEETSSAEIKAPSLDGLNRHDLQPLAPEEVPVADIASAEISGEPQVVLVEPAGAMVEIPVLADQLIPRRPKRVGKPPIIDLPSTRLRSTEEDMAELDEEISELRRVLASKLSVQNEQIRKLLRRFPS